MIFRAISAEGARMRATLPLLSLLIAGTAACADKPRPEPRVQTTVSTSTAAATPPRQVSRNISVSDDIAKACKISFGDVNRAPKFDFDRSELLPEDRDVLDQIARCLTTGSLKGRALALVGRTDSRGEPEYNMGLGEHRAGSVRLYLTRLGVDARKVGETSRGELDATGTDENGWRKDRRVDISLR
jgi:peptidoglycan-associated lipoprotein